MGSPLFSITLLGLATAAVLLGFAHRALDRMKMNSQTALIILLVMVLAHFLPEIKLSSLVSLNLGALLPLGVAFYLLLTTSAREAWRAIGVSAAVGFVLWLSDKLLPIEPGASWDIVDPLFFGGIAAGLLADVWGRSRRSAFIGGILGVLLADIAAMVELYLQGIPQTTTIGSGGIFSSLILNPIIAVFVAEGIGEIRERIHRGPALRSGGEGEHEE